MVSEDAFRTFLELIKTEFDDIKSQITTIKDELNELHYEVMVKGAMKEPKKDKIDSKTPLIPNNSIKTNLLPKISTGNEGVQTHRHIDTQTDNTPLFPLDGKPLSKEKTPTHPTTETSTHLRHIPEKPQHFDTFLDTQTHNQTQNAKISDLNKLMDSLKEDLKKKFQSLTKQEFHIFSVIFTLDKTQNQVTYQDIAVQTGLTSSSIRDYVRRISQKGIPLLKDKVNNKLTVLKIPPELRNLATLDNLMRIRGIAKDSDLDRFAQK